MSSNVVDKFFEFYSSLSSTGFLIKITPRGYYFVYRPRNISYNTGIIPPTFAPVNPRRTNLTTIPGAYVLENIVTIESFLHCYSYINSTGWLIRVMPHGWTFEHESLVHSYEGIIPRPVPGIRMGFSFEEDMPRWYTMPTTSPESPTPTPPPPPTTMPQQLLKEPPPQLSDCAGCPICLNENAFPNVVWECGHCICQCCVVGMEASTIPVRCPMCRKNGPFFVLRICKKSDL